MNGDQLLSANDLSLWRLVQHVLLTWGTLVVLKNDHYDVPRQRDGLVTFFVPRDATFKDEIVTFLEHEGQQFASDGFAARPAQGIPRIPPIRVKVEVVTFSGLLPYMEREQSEAAAREFTSVFMQRITSQLAQGRKDDLKSAGAAPWWGAFEPHGVDPVAAFADEESAVAWQESRMDGNWRLKPIKNPFATTSPKPRAEVAPAVEMFRVDDATGLVEADDLLELAVEVWLSDDYEHAAECEDNHLCPRRPIKTYPPTEALLSSGRVGQFDVKDLPDSVVGLKIGEYGEVEVDLPGDYDVAEGRNEPAVLRMKVLGIKRPTKKVRS